MAKTMDPKTMTIEQRKAALRCREASLENFDEEKRTAQISFASDTPCIDFWGDFNPQDTFIINTLRKEYVCNDC